jgi:sensor histidine kinase YesM
MVRTSFLYPPDHLWENTKAIIFNSFAWNLCHNIFFSYTVVYFLVPKFFLKKRYVAFAIGILLLFVVVFGLNLLYVFANAKFTHAIGLTSQHPFIFLRGSIIRLFGNPPLICGILLSLKTLKTWHQKQLENEMLTREKANAELQLLKAQIHPHFLFNTLNNIYSFTLTKSPQASELVQKLSDMLNYMITDCDRTMVPVEKEIQLIKDYIGLEKVRYGDRLDIQMHVNGECKDHMIAPLLMIPFVENCFKHGASMMRGKQWMQLIININDHELDFDLRNSKPSQPNTTKNKTGIGLLNVQKRLGLLYPGKHHLDISSTDNAFSVHLRIELQKDARTGIEKNLKIIPKQTVLKPGIHS